MTGPKVLAIMLAAFGTVIAVNLTLAWSAVSTFPGLEVKNSYVASQNFNAELAAQQALGWDVSADVWTGDELVLSITGPTATPRRWPRWTHAGRGDPCPRRPAPGVRVPERGLPRPGRYLARELEHPPARDRADGTLFQQRVVLHVEE